jgi:serine protease Do
MRYFVFIVIGFLITACNNAENDAINQQLKDTQAQLNEIKQQRIADSIAKDSLLHALKDSVDLSTSGNIKNLTQLYQNLKSSIFFVYNYGNEAASQGTAFVIGGGLALTNAHCIDEGGDIFLVNQTGDRFDVVDVVEQDAEIDYAIIKFKLNGKTFTPLTFATTLPEIGEPTFAIGNPRGLEQTLSTGIVSGYRENNKLIQTTTEIAGGSSGGPLFNKEGQVIGITTSGYQDANLNFAVNAQKIPYLVKTGKVSASKANWYTVKTPKAYFYQSPNSESITNVYIVKNDRVVANSEKQGFVFVTFKNERTGDETSGWLSLTDVAKEF